MKKITYRIKPTHSLRSSIQVPGDKSISHRAIMLSALANGTSEIHGFLAGEDCLATMQAMQAMGVSIESLSAANLRVHGVGLHGLQTPKHPINMGNSGTAMRLLAGILVGQKFKSVLVGDESLSKRPMSRIINPLRLMGAKIQATNDTLAPLEISGVDSLKAIDYVMPMASAQVKSCVLLAGLYAKGATIITEPAPCRDHSERMLQSFGVELRISGHKISLLAPQSLRATKIIIPGDISSAAFFMVAASISPNSEILLTDVGINPTRIGVINILKMMGANITYQNQRQFGAEPVADILVKSANLHGIEIPHDQIPLAIDEFPAIFIAAACADGVTKLCGAEELRVKESDRIHVMAEGLKSLGIKVQETNDGIIIEGGKLQGGMINSHGDHRIAMAFAVAGNCAQGEVIIKDCANVATSFPNFVELARKIGMIIELS